MSGAAYIRPLPRISYQPRIVRELMRPAHDHCAGRAVRSSAAFNHLPAAIPVVRTGAGINHLEEPITPIPDPPALDPLKVRLASVFSMIPGYRTTIPELFVVPSTSITNGARKRKAA